MADSVTIVECPRDAWQGLPMQIPSEEKVEYLRLILDAGFRHIDAVSFVSPAAIPQMSDSEEVLARLDPPSGVELIGIVVNVKGAERAIATEAVHTLGFPWSVSSEFLKRNQHQTQEESFSALRSIVARARNSGLNELVYLSMAFGNPYGEIWSIDKVIDACNRLADVGIRKIMLADTVGQAAPARIAETIEAVLEAHGGIDIGVHLHARPDEVDRHILAAYDAGCRRFDAALGGLGGCPFAQDAMVGNIPTEALIAVLAERGALLPPLADLNELLRANARIAGNYAALDKQ